MQHIYLTDNSRVEMEIPSALRPFQGKNVRQLLANNPYLLWIGDSLSEDKIEEQVLFSIEGEKTIQTYCLMGFIGIGDNLGMSISSRFSQSNRVGERKAPDKDFFLYYLLAKVFHFNWLVKFPFSLGPSHWMDLFPMLFPNYLNAAVRQGIFKQYITMEHNDSNLKGRIDVARHLKYNLPFQGRFSYTTREYSADNPVTQLIRHTIEYIRTLPWGNQILHNTRETVQNVQLIVGITPSYSTTDREKVILQNKKKINTPFFSTYIPLQRLCLNILQKRRVSFGNDERKLYGLIFDGAWLWEKYLDSLLRPLGFLHPDNKKRSLPCYLFTNNTFPRYCDFYKEGIMVIDAKYKNLVRKDQLSRDDLHQIITYMHILSVFKGALAYPTQNPVASFDKVGNLNGIGGSIYLLGMTVPNVANREYHEFVDEIEKCEIIFQNSTRRLLQTDKDVYTRF